MSARDAAIVSHIDVDAYCSRCNSDQHTAQDPARHGHLRWCSLCWDWQQDLPPNLKALIRLGMEADRG